MARLLRASRCALCFAWCASAPAAAYHVDPKTQAVTIHSLRDFDACRGDDEHKAEPCLEALRSYVEKRPRHAFEAGKHVCRHYMHWLALDFFVKALSGAHARDRCDDEDVRAAVVAGLSLPSHYPAVAQAQKLVSETCRDQLASFVIAELDQASGHFRSNACPLVRSQVRGAACEVPREASSVAAAPPAPLELPSVSDQMALAPRVREAPPVRKEATHQPPVQQLMDVFPSVGALQNAGSPAAPAKVDSESGELLRGTHGEELLMARTQLAGREYVLLKFKGVRGPWNERVLLTVERRSGKGKDYLVADDGRETVVMIERQRQYQAFPKGVKGGLWFNPVRPGEPDVTLPSRRQIANELATAPSPGK